MEELHLDRGTSSSRGCTGRRAPRHAGGLVGCERVPGLDQEVVADAKDRPPTRTDDPFVRPDHPCAHVAHRDQLEVDEVDIVQHCAGVVDLRLAGGGREGGDHRRWDSAVDGGLVLLGPRGGVVGLVPAEDPHAVPLVDEVGHHLLPRPTAFGDTCSRWL